MKWLIDQVRFIAGMAVVQLILVIALFAILALIGGPT